MIKKIVMAIAIVGALCSCQQKMSVSNQMEGQVTTVSFNVPVQQTKSTTPYLEDVVNSLQVFVFNLDGTLDAAGSSSASSLNLTCTTGEKEIYALVNAPVCNKIKMKDDLLSIRLNLSVNSKSGLLMEGFARHTLTPNASVSIPVYRSAARVSLKSVNTAFELEVYKRMEFRVDKVMLINVAGDKKITGNIDGALGYKEEPTLWYNKQGNSVSPLDVLSDIVLDSYITAAKPYNVPHYFYCYPNPTTVDSTADVWSPRHTRLVVSATMGGVVYYYPISIPEIKANMCYDVTLTVTRPGSASPDVPVEKLESGVSIDVKPWGVAAQKDEII